MASGTRARDAARASRIGVAECTQDFEAAAAGGIARAAKCGRPAEGRRSRGADGDGIFGGAVDWRRRECGARLRNFGKRINAEVTEHTELAEKKVRRRVRGE